MLEYAVLALALVAAVSAVPVDNGVAGDPEIECGPTSITVNFNTQNEFEGHVYVKSLYNEPGCRSDEGGRQVAGITLPFDTCSTRRIRSLNPKALTTPDTRCDVSGGVFVSTTVIVSFHPLFITKVDRAYRVQCFYMEADKTVDTRLEVSMLTTELQTQQVPMPVCRYEILNEPTGTPIEFARVGQPIFHKWTCDSETVETFCMVVHSCFVDDTNGDAVQLINEEGCAEDVYLLNNPEYTTDLMAGVDAHVFKYADRADLYFQCQIAVLVKEPSAACPRPSCGSPAGRGAGSANPQLGPARGVQEPWPLLGGSPYLPGGRAAARVKRSSPLWAHMSLGSLDVQSSLAALDVAERASAAPLRLPSLPSPHLCLSNSGVALGGGLFAAALLLAGAVIAGLARRSSSRKE